jgi:hypothetical protein
LAGTFCTLDNSRVIRHHRPESTEAMKDHQLPAKESRGKSVVVFVTGLLVGVGAGALFSGVRSSRSETAPPPSIEENTVTFAGATGTEGRRTDALALLLDAEGDAGRGLHRTREILALVDGLKPGEFAARLDEVFARRRGSEGYDVITNLYQKWVEIDPEAALQHAESLAGKDRKTALNAVLSAWAVKKPHEVIAWIEENGAGESFQSPVYAALRAIAREDPEEAINLISANKALRGGGRALGSDGRVVSMAQVDPGFLYGIWAEKDPRAAAAKALSIPNAQERGNAIRSLAREWSGQDPLAAWEWAEAIESPRMREDLLEMIIGSVMAEGDTRQAIALLGGMPTGKGRSGALDKIATHLAVSDPRSAFDFVKSQIQTSGDEEAYSSVLSQWARTDPTRAIQFALELESGKARSSAIQAIFNDTASRDPALAIELLAQVDEETLRGSVYSLAYNLARHDVNGALGWVESLPEGEVRDNAFSNVISEWANQDPKAACTHLARIQDESDRRRGLDAALSRWGYEDAVAAMTWAVENLDPKDQERLLSGSLINSWADQDMGGAAEWVAALPGGELQKRAVSNLVQKWARDDLVAAGNWLKKLKSGEARDGAVRSYADQVFAEDPEAALIWADSIGDEASRFSQVEHLAGRYLEKSPEKAKRWIARSSLPPERQAELLKAVENR